MVTHLFGEISFARTNENRNLYLKSETKNKVLLVEIFFDDIIFGGHDFLCKLFASDMKKLFEMSMIGEIKFFFNMQVY